MKKFDENYVSLSALNQYSYCPRRCFFIHVEGIFEENVYTLEGRFLHERANSGARTVRGSVVEHRRVYLVSHRLQMRGISDLIEEENGLFRPVEYKRGRRGQWYNDDMQLCAQAICLEEMLDLKPLPEGAIYYAQSGRRRIVPFTDELRAETERTVEAVRALIESGRDPGAILTPRCEGCSLYKICLPAETSKLRALNIEEIFSKEDQ